jgi:hypothetical protein
MKIRYAKNLITGSIETQDGGTEGVQSDLDLMQSNMIGDGANGLTPANVEVGWEEEAIVLEWAKSFTDSLKTYSDKRKEEYDKLNQFELIGEDSINGTTNHRDAIIAIKEKYPKE